MHAGQQIYVRVIAKQGRGGRCAGVQSDRAGHRDLRGVVLHPTAEIERRVTL